MFFVSNSENVKSDTNREQKYSIHIITRSLNRHTKAHLVLDNEVLLSKFLGCSKVHLTMLKRLDRLWPNIINFLWLENSKY